MFRHVNLLYLFVFGVHLLKSSSASKADYLKQPVYKCPYPATPNKEQHSGFLDGLNGTHVVFIGDSITRFVWFFLCGDVVEALGRLQRLLLFLCMVLNRYALQIRLHVLTAGRSAMQVPVHNSGKFSCHRSVSKQGHKRKTIGLSLPL